MEQGVELIRKFESLGDNCEFGLVQRALGHEPLGMFRFAGVDLDGLILALTSRFAGVAEPENMAVALSGVTDPREYMVTSRLYHFNYHTGSFEDRLSAGEVVENETIRLRFYARKMMDDLECGKKIFVFKHNETVDADRIAALFDAIRAIGPGDLVWVAQATAEISMGHVERTAAGYYRAYIDRFAGYHEADKGSAESWLAICSNTKALIESHKTTIG